MVHNVKQELEMKEVVQRFYIMHAGLWNSVSLQFPVPHMIFSLPGCSDVDRPHTRINARCNRWCAPLLFLSGARTTMHAHVHTE